MVRKVLLGVGAVLVLLVLVIATRPSTFHIERSITIAAPPEVVFAHIDDFHEWAAWSPWEKLDPQMKRTYGGAPKGTGATYGWTGNDQVGEGRMTITEAVPPSKVAIKLEFIKPFAMVNDTLFVLTPAGEGTKLTWNMDGRHNFVSKGMSLFMDMDKQVGPDFERGLAAIKDSSESKKTPEAPKSQNP